MSCYSIYLDETGDFQGSPFQKNIFYGIFGFVWEGDPAALKDQTKQLCLSLADWLKQENKDSGLPFPRCLHTTENKQFKDALAEHAPEKDVLHSRLSGLSFSVAGIYAYEPEVDQSDFDLDDLYRKMIHMLIRQITARIRAAEPEARITFHIPTRSTTFEYNEKKKKEFQQRDIIVSLKKDKETGEADQSVSLNTPEAYYSISRELDVICSVREIKENTDDPDRDDEAFHKSRNPESTVWGYYTADIINYWMRTIVNQPEKDTETIEKEISGLIRTFLLLPFSREIEEARTVRDHLQEDPCACLETCMKLNAVQNPTPRTRYALRILEEPNPFADPSVTQAVAKQIDRMYIHESKYNRAKVLLEQLKALCERTADKGSWAYGEIISRLMTCYHHEGGNTKAQELFRIVSQELGPDSVKSMDICNKYQEFFVNTLAFEQGISFVEAVLEEFKPAAPAVRLGGITVSGGEMSAEAKLVLARTQSSLGSLYAYTGQREKAEEHFRKSIGSFTEIGKTINAQITRSHLIHLMLDTENIHSESLLREMNLYLSNDAGSLPDPDNPATWDKWLKDSITQNTDDTGKFNPENASFPLWIWLKAAVKLSDETIQSDRAFIRITSSHPELWDILKIRKHPAEMIRKYHALLMQRAGDQRSIRKDLEILEEIIRLNEQHGTIPLLCRAAKYDISRLQMTEEDIAALEKGLYEDIRKLYTELHQGNDDQMTESLIDRLYKKGSVRMSDLKESLRYEFR